MLTDLVIRIAAFCVPLLIVAGVLLFHRFTKSKQMGFSLQERVSETMEIMMVKIDVPARRDEDAQIRLESLVGNLMGVPVTIRDVSFDFKLNGRSVRFVRAKLSIFVRPLQYRNFGISFEASPFELSHILRTRPPTVNLSAAGSMTIIAHDPGSHLRPKGDVHETATFNLRSTVPIKIPRPERRHWYSGLLRFLDRIRGRISIQPVAD